MIAIDPGSTQSAVVEITKEGVKWGRILPNTELITLIDGFSDKPLAMEMIASYGMAVGEEVFNTCVWIGRFIQAHGGQHRFVKRMEVKMHLCQDSRAKDANIRQVLLDRIGAQGTKKNPGPLYGFKADMFAALGVGLTALETRGEWKTR